METPALLHIYGACTLHKKSPAEYLQDFFVLKAIRLISFFETATVVEAAAVAAETTATA